jgi:hypothetical protein
MFDRFGHKINNGLVGLPLHERPGITLPTPANLDRVAADAAAQRASDPEVQSNSASALGRHWGISRDFVLDYQRLTARVAELERELASLRADRYSALPAHLRDVEKR